MFYIWSILRRIEFWFTGGDQGLLRCAVDITITSIKIRLTVGDWKSCCLVVWVA